MARQVLSVLLTSTAMLVWPSDTRAAAPEAEASTTFAERTILLVDDHAVLYRSGTRRVMHPAVRQSTQPLIAEEKPWEVAIAWTSCYRNPRTGKLQLWYQAYAGKAAQQKTHESLVCYAESTDGITFTKPNLGLHSFNDIEDTNIVLLGNGGYGDRYGNAVVVDEHEPDPQHRYKMAYYDWSFDGAREVAGLHVAFSPDGIRWHKHGGALTHTSYGGRGLQPPLSDDDPYVETALPDGRVRKTWHLPLTMSDAADVMYDPQRKLFAIYGKAWINGPDGALVWKHAMGRIESSDFLTWSKPQLLLFPDEFDPPEIEFHTSPVFYHAGCYFCLNQMLDRRAEGGIYLELMISRDGIAWQRPFRDQPFLPRGAQGAFDSGSLFSNATPVMLDDEMRFYYGAYGSTAIGGGQSILGSQQQSGVGLATLARDRFAGLRPVAVSAQPTLRKPLENIGQVTLKPIDLTDCREILINADASQGALAVELLNADGYRVRGFSKDDCQPLTTDALRHTVSWRNQKLAELPPGRYMLRLHLDNAEVFAATLR